MSTKLVQQVLDAMPEEFDIQQGCPEFLKDWWFAWCEVTGAVAISNTEEDARNRLLVEVGRRVAQGLPAPKPVISDKPYKGMLFWIQAPKETWDKVCEDVFGLAREMDGLDILPLNHWDDEDRTRVRIWLNHLQGNVDDIQEEGPPPGTTIHFGKLP